MGYYALRDVETDDAGELQVENGDLKLASTKRSHIQALHWVILTNRGEYMWGDSVANLGAFIGSLNLPRTHRGMEASTLRALSNQSLFFKGDVRIKVVPIDYNDALITARMFGDYELEEGEEPEDEDQLLGYVYPFGTGLPVKVDVPTAD